MEVFALPSELEKELESLMNRYSIDAASNTPDFVLAAYLAGCLETYVETARLRDKWWGFDPSF